jgi:hypothetical protein
VVDGRADLCVMVRPHLRDPYWTLHAAEMQEYYALRWPVQYESVQPRPREPLKFLKDPKREAEEREREVRRLRRRVWELERRLGAAHGPNGAASADAEARPASPRGAP